MGIYKNFGRVAETLFADTTDTAKFNNNLYVIIRDMETEEDFDELVYLMNSPKMKKRGLKFATHDITTDAYFKPYFDKTTRHKTKMETFIAKMIAAGTEFEKSTITAIDQTSFQTWYELGGRRTIIGTPFHPCIGDKINQVISLGHVTDTSDEAIEYLLERVSEFVDSPNPLPEYGIWYDRVRYYLVNPFLDKYTQFIPLTVTIGYTQLIVDTLHKIGNCYWNEDCSRRMAYNFTTEVNRMLDVNYSWWRDWTSSGTINTVALNTRIADIENDLMIQLDAPPGMRICNLILADAATPKVTTKWEE